MYVVHWFNSNTNQDYLRYYRYVDFRLIEGLQTDRGHLVLGIYYLYKGLLISKNEYNDILLKQYKSVEELLLDIM